MVKKVLSAAAAATVGLGLIAGSASADPKPEPGQTARVDCGSGWVDFVASGNGAWTPGHDLAGNAVYVPVAFVGVTSAFQVFDADGNLLFEDTIAEEDTAKNGNRTGVDLQECSFEIGYSGYDAQNDLYYEGTSWGTVVLKTAAT